MISTTNINQLLKEIQKQKKDKQSIIVQAQSPEFNRKIFENPNIDVITDLEFHSRKDYTKQRDSGLNEILCKLATRNKIKIAINLDKIKKLEKKQKAIILSRTIQNIKLCKRTKTQMIIFPKNKYTKQERTSFFLSLKASTQQAKQSEK